MPPPDANLQLVMFLCYLMNVALSALLVASGRPFPGARLWVVAQGLLSLGTGFDALPPGVPLWIPLVVGNASYAASSVLFVHSVWAYRFHSPFSRWFYALVVVQLLSFALTLNQPYWIRSVLFSFWMTVGPLATSVILVWGVERHLRFSHWLTAHEPTATRIKPAMSDSTLMRETTFYWLSGSCAESRQVPWRPLRRSEASRGQSA